MLIIIHTDKGNASIIAYTAFFMNDSLILFQERQR